MPSNIYVRALRGIGVEVREAIVDVMNRLYSRGLRNNSGGNASARLEVAPETGLVYITPSGPLKNLAGPEGVAVITLDGHIVAGKPSSEYRLHLAIYNVRRDVNAIVHAHNPLTVALSKHREIFEKVTASIVEARYYVGRIAWVPSLEPGTIEFAEAAAHASKNADTLVLEGHGVVGLGDRGDPVEALYTALDRVEALEDLARVVLGDAHLSRFSGEG